MITFAVLFTVIINYTVISDNEYAENEKSWELEECDRNYEYDNTLDKQVKIERTEEEVLECKNKKKVKLIKYRKYDFKKVVINTLIWFIIFITIFSVHFPKLRKLK